MIREFSYPEKRNKFEKFISDNGGSYIWHDGDVMRVYAGDDVPKIKLSSVSDLQIRLALINAGLIDVVESWVSGSKDKEIQAWWDRSLRFERDNPMVETAAKSLGVDSKQLDELWLLAATL